MRASSVRRERGVALIALLAVVALGASWFLVSKLNAESAVMTAINRNRNAEILSRAKQALIGYVGAQAAKTGENRPGALPCPEAALDFNDPANEGTVSYPCTLPKVGRFPWRTLGLDKLVDVSGEPLWYVVSPGWAGANTVINSNSVGQLTVDGVANDAIALIIAPGPAFSVPACAGNAAWNQVRPTTAPPDWRNYLECENATWPAPDASFVTTGPSGSFNDQVVKITAADILPAIEAGIATRIEREIAPQIRGAYQNAGWGGTTVLPFASNFADPSTSTMKGSGAASGLLPLSYSETSPGSGTQCSPNASDPRCDPMFVAWTGAPALSNRGGGATLYSSSCSVSTVTVNPAPLTQTTWINCTFQAYSWALAWGAPQPLNFRLAGSATNVGNALRQFNTSANMSGVDAAGRVASGTLNSDGSAAIIFDGSAAVGAGNVVSDALCGLPLLGWIWELLFDCYQGTISMPVTLLADHALLDPSTGSTYGWFLRNKWHEVAYYAVAPNLVPSGTRSCITGTSCLSVVYHRNNAGVVDDGAQRAILILSGRSLAGAARPNGTLSDWLEGANADGASPFELRSATSLINRTFNDRFAVLDSN